MGVLDWFLTALGIGAGVAVSFLVIVEIAIRYQQRSIDKRIDELLRLKERLDGNN